MDSDFGQEWIGEWETTGGKWARRRSWVVGRTVRASTYDSSSDEGGGSEPVWKTWVRREVARVGAFRRRRTYIRLPDS